MNVRELIEELYKRDPDDRVCLVVPGPICRQIIENVERLEFNLIVDVDHLDGLFQTFIWGGEVVY